MDRIAPDQLARVTIFRRLSPEDRARVAAVSRIREYAKGDTIFAEGQRRYVESLSAYARQFLGQMDKPDVEIGRAHV